MAAKTLRPCTCSTYFVVADDGSRSGTGCTGNPTARTFAPGHDAKLKGFLIRSAGKDIHCTDGITRSVLGVASSYGFGDMVRAGIERPAKVRKPRGAKLAEAEVAVLPVKAKVGRWTYEGLVMEGEFLYQDKGGESRRTTTFKLV